MQRSPAARFSGLSFGRGNSLPKATQAGPKLGPSRKALPLQVLDFPTQRYGAAYRIRTCDPIITNETLKLLKADICHCLKCYFVNAETYIPNPAQTRPKSILGVFLLKVLWLSRTLESHPAPARLAL